METPIRPNCNSVSLELHNVDTSRDVSLELHNVDASRHEGKDVSLEIQNLQEGKDLDLPAPWIYHGLVDGDRSRIVNIEVEPERENTGHRLLKYWDNTSFHPSRKCLRLDLTWRVTFHNEQGEIETATRTLPMFTRIPRPPRDDAAAEMEVAQRLTMVTKAYTHPVLASLDPHRREDSLWKKIDEICDTEVFTVDSTTRGENNKENWKRWTIRYGKNSTESYEGNAIDQRMQLLTQGAGEWRAGPMVQKKEAVRDDTFLQASDRFFHVFDPPHFGVESLAINELYKQAPDVITRTGIRESGIQTPYNYLKRLETEIGHQQSLFDDLRTLLVERSGWFNNDYKPTEEFAEFLSLYRRGVTKRLLSKVRLADTALAEKLNALNLQEGAVKQKLTSKQAELKQVQERIGAREANAEEAPKLNALKEEVKQWQQKHLQLEGAKLELKKQLHEPRREWESRLAVMTALQASIEKKSAQIKSLLTRSLEEGGWGLEEQDSLLTPEQKQHWQESLHTLEENKKIRQEAIDTTTDLLRNVGIDFSDDQEKVSVAHYLEGLVILMQETEQFLTKSAQDRQAQRRGLCEQHSFRGHELLQRLDAEEQALKAMQPQIAEDINQRVLAVEQLHQRTRDELQKLQLFLQTNV